MEQEICIMDVQPTNLQQLHDAIMSIWTKFSEECFQHLFEPMPQRMKAVLKAKEGPTCISKVYYEVGGECRWSTTGTGAKKLWNFSLSHNDQPWALGIRGEEAKLRDLWAAFRITVTIRVTVASADRRLFEALVDKNLPEAYNGPRAPHWTCHHPH